MSMKGSGPIILDDDRLAAVSSIVGAIAHDFNNLLTPFLAYPPLIKNDLPEGSNGAALLDVMEKTARDMVHMTQQLLDFSARDDFPRIRVDINELISEVLLQLNMEGGIPPGVTVQKTLAAELGPVNGVPDQISHVVRNIVINAVEAVGTNGGVEVWTAVVQVGSGTTAYGYSYAGGTYVRVSVADSGPGVPEGIRSQLFEPFFTTKKGGERRGAGLGLSVAFRLVKQHGGYIELQCEEDKGALFNVYLPVEGVVAHAAPSASPAGGAVASPALLKCDRQRILVVDDEKTILRLFQMILASSMTGYAIDTATNGEEAIAAFSDKHHAVLIMDLHMPVMDGQAAFIKLSSLCEEKRWEMPSVIFCTGFAPPDSIRSVIEAGGPHRLLSKPVSGEAIVEAVKGRLAK